MTFVITSRCCGDAACVAVCPVQCIRPRPGDPDFTTAEQLYIDPRSCIDCSACEPVCPIDAISPDYDLDADDTDLIVNADYFDGEPTPEEAAPTPTRRTVPDNLRPLLVAIVGAGPSACYAATALSAIDGVEVTLIDRLPTPFGLVRFGVAPDHAHTKGVTAQFRAALARPNVTCMFNVEAGRDFSLDELRAAHHAVIWAAGADQAAPLNVPGEYLPGSHSAAEFVAWYNGHPDHADAVFDLSGSRVIVIGNGNVALDVARVLTQPLDRLARTDIANHALEGLGTSAVNDVRIVARKDQHQAACSLGELDALCRVPGVTVRASNIQLDLEEPVAQAIYPRGVSALDTRKLDLFTAAAARDDVPGSKTVTFMFGMAPRRIEGTDRVSAVTFERTVTEVVDGRPVTRGIGDEVTVPADLVLTATGYRTQGIDGLPIDATTGRVHNTRGRVVDQTSVIAGLYCTGWARRGSRGVIGTNRADAEEVVSTVIEDFIEGQLNPPAAGEPSFQELITARGVPVVDARGWSRIDEHERALGRESGRPRVKLTHVQDLVRVASSQPDPVGAFS